MQLLIEKISMENEIPFFIPEGRDSRLKRVTSAMHENVRIDYTLNHWSNIAGASPRTLARLFELEMGMTFSTWRQQLCLIRATEMLLKGQSITDTAFMLGYSSAGNFTSMFTQAMSKSPTAYLKDWNTEQIKESSNNVIELPYRKHIKHLRSP
ncbi:MAG: helix-turn-helix domain-containing protein [Candidatus Nitrotoga sp.]